MNKLLFAPIAFLVLLFNAGPAHAADYYWVGGSGIWDDYANHWATTSGGSVFHTQAPTVADNVYFDDSSFTAAQQLVLIDGNAFCHNMNWSGVTNVPEFSMATNQSQLTVYGSLVLDAAMSFTLFDGTLVFSSASAGETIATAGHTLPCAIDFHGIGGAWTLLDALTTSNAITLTAGTLETNNHAVTCNTFTSVSAYARALDLGTSIVTILGDSITNDWEIPSAVALNATNAVIRLHDNSGFSSTAQTYHIIEWMATGDVSVVPYNLLNDDSLQVDKVISHNMDYAMLMVNCSNSVIDSLVSYAYMTMNGSGNTFRYVYVRQDLYGAASNSYQTLVGSSLNINGANSFGNIICTNWLELYGNNIIGSAFAAKYASLGGISTIDRLEVKGNAYIGGQQNIDTCILWSDGNFTQNDHQLGFLTLAGGNKYTFVSGKTQTIDSLVIRGVTAYTELVASNLNSPANVVIAKPLCTDSLSIKSVHASGSNALSVGDHSLLVSSNATGWVFDTCTRAADCFITGNTMICDGDSSAFSTVGGVAYVWAGPNGFTTTAASTGAIGVAGTYSVTITLGTGLTMSCSETLIVKPACNDNLVCTADTCNPYLGCTFGTMICDDGHLCTEDICDPVTGCISTPIPGCSGPCDTLVCDDFDSCTSDTCDSGICIFTAVSCDDGDLCTYDECLGFCSHAWLYCDDQNACTIDACNSTSTGCDRTPVICDDGDVCTTDQCDTVLACIGIPVSCDDGDACTNDGCDTTSGCTFVTIPGCNNPCDTLLCDDSNVCTIDSCANASCINAVINCDDGTVCTIDACDSVATGCSNIQISCDDGVSCTIDNCNAWIGCTHNFYTISTTFATTPASCDTCSDGTATMFASNGTGNYSFLWNTTPQQGTQTAVNLPGGDVSVCVTDNNGCMQCDTTNIVAFNCAAGFDLFPDATVPHHYYIINTSTGEQQFTYVWTWGDGASDTGAYPSHTYSAAGNYIICLYITDAEGCADSLCVPYMLNKDGGAMIFVQVVDSSFFTAIEDVALEQMQPYPNPTAGNITLKAAPKVEQAVSIRLFDALGKELWQQQHAGIILQEGLVIDLNNQDAGIYFLHMQSTSGSKVVKVVRY